MGLLQYFRDNRDPIPYSIGPGYSETNAYPYNRTNIQEALAKAFRTTPQVGFGEAKPNDWRVCPEMWAQYPRIFSSLYVHYSSNPLWKLNGEGNSTAFTFSIPHGGNFPDGRLNDHGFQWSNDGRKATRIKSPHLYPWFADSIPEFPRLGYGPDVCQPYGRLGLNWFDASFPGGYLNVAPFHGKKRLANFAFQDGHCETVQMQRIYTEGASFFRVRG